MGVAPRSDARRSVDHRVLDDGVTPIFKSEPYGSCLGEIQAATGYVGTSVTDDDLEGLAVSCIGHLEACAKRQ